MSDPLIFDGVPASELDLTPQQRARLNELAFRRTLVKFFIRTLDRNVPKDDPRREGALEEYKRQLARIDEKIAAITGRPPDIRVGLKPAVLFAKSEKKEGGK